MPTTPSQPAPTANRRIRVFISSTFRDMIGERDELMTLERKLDIGEFDIRDFASVVCAGVGYTC
jgi:hypothetical protein